MAEFPELDICVSANSNLVHIEEKVSGRNIATMTMKNSSKEEKISLAMKFAAALDLLDALEEMTPNLPPNNASCHSNLVPQSECGNCSRITKALKAIAKAKGL